MIENVKKLVYEMLEYNTNAHGNDHIERVYHLAIKFAEEEKADMDIVSLAALLHDVDDYKLVGLENAKKLNNAKEIMRKVDVDQNTQDRVLNIIGTMGYSNYLRGIRPNNLEGAIVSDADMCDAIGASGIIRSIVYALSSKGNNRIFDKDIFPIVNITSEEYNGLDTTHDTDGAINHFFEKLLKLKKLMLTNSGKEEASRRHKLMVNFLRQLFIEENVPIWQEFLDNYLDEFYPKSK